MNIPAPPRWLFRILLVITLIAAMRHSAHGHDIYQELTKDSRCICGGHPQEQVCEAVEAIPQGKDSYYLPASGEMIPASMAEPSPDDRFHRCTYPLNLAWRGRGYAPAYPGANYEMNGTMIERQGPEAWVAVPNNQTKDGKPPTRCFWAPMVGF